jgi:hypothetical protein
MTPNKDVLKNGCAQDDAILQKTKLTHYQNGAG